MNLRILRTSLATENEDALHEARLLILLSFISDTSDGCVKGITKLAKLDFLLRYPTYLYRLLPECYKRIPNIPMSEYEIDTVESKMIRFRYGPWDKRYRRWLSNLVSKGLINTYISGVTQYIGLTEFGKQLSIQLKQEPDYHTIIGRSELLGKLSKKLTGTKLKDLIYKVVPELTGMSWGEEIEP